MVVNLGWAIDVSMTQMQRAAQKCSHKTKGNRAGKAVLTSCLCSCWVCFWVSLLLVHSIKETLASHLELGQQLLEARAGDKVVENQTMTALAPAVKQNSQDLVHNTLKVAHGFWCCLVKHDALALALALGVLYLFVPRT